MSGECATDNGFYTRSYVDSLQNELTAANEKVNNSIQLLSEADYDYNKKTNALIERHAQQLTVMKEHIAKLEAELAGYRGVDNRGSQDCCSFCPEVKAARKETAQEIIVLINTTKGNPDPYGYLDTFIDGAVDDCVNVIKGRYNL
jgi:hypothetical protein